MRSSGIDIPLTIACLQPRVMDLKRLYLINKVNTTTLKRMLVKTNDMMSDNGEEFTSESTSFGLVKGFVAGLRYGTLLDLNAPDWGLDNGHAVGCVVDAVDGIGLSIGFDHLTSHSRVDAVFTACLLVPHRSRIRDCGAEGSSGNASRLSVQVRNLAIPLVEGVPVERRWLPPHPAVLDNLSSKDATICDSRCSSVVTLKSEDVVATKAFITELLISQLHSLLGIGIVDVEVLSPVVVVPVH